jgi:hypothetical protein
MKAKTKKEIAGALAAAAVVFFGGGLSVISTVPILTWLLVGLSGICVLLAAILIEWFEFMAKRWVQMIGFIAIVIVTLGGIFSTRTPTPSITDPEAAENKYVRITRIPSPYSQFKYAALIEFGVKKINSEGFVARICPNTEDWRDWYGTPGNTHPQTEFTIPHFDPNDGVLWVWAPEFAISPRMSYYVCLLANRAEQCEPNDILYFAIAGNASTLLSSQQNVLGHQYTRKQ